MATRPLFKSTQPAERHPPLAERMRPKEWESFVENAALTSDFMAELKAGVGVPPSLVLWGPPGSGKTTIARLIGRSFPCEFVELSAVSVGIKEVRDLVAEAKNRAQPTLLFMDEIHRFNRAQQDAFLPHIEDGTIAFIGATTENPSFYLTGALLSRVRTVVLEPLSLAAIGAIVNRAQQALGRSCEQAVVELIVAASGGDARRALNLVERLCLAVPAGEVSLSDARRVLGAAASTVYDRSGEEHYNVASAFIKSLRGSDPDAALYWGFRMLKAGEDPRFLIRRMIIFASEDIGNADPRALSLAISTAEAFERVGLPEGEIPIAQCITYLASTAKSNRSYAALKAVKARVEATPFAKVPLHLRNAPTALMADLGYGAAYQYPHDHEGSFVPGVQYLPDGLSDERYYEPSDSGAERTFRERLGVLRGKGTKG